MLSGVNPMLLLSQIYLTIVASFMYTAQMKLLSIQDTLPGSTMSPRLASHPPVTLRWQLAELSGRRHTPFCMARKKG